MRSRYVEPTRPRERVATPPDWFEISEDGVNWYKRDANYPGGRAIYANMTHPDGSPYPLMTREIEERSK